MYLIDANTGARTLVMKKMKQQPSLSVTAKYLAYFHDGAWQVRNVATGKTAVNVTAGVKDVSFFDEELVGDADEPRPFGLMGFTKDDSRMLVYDRTDVWELDPAGVAAPVNVTGGAGKRSDITYRLGLTDREDPGIDPGAAADPDARSTTTRKRAATRARRSARCAAPEAPRDGAALRTPRS